MSLNLIAGGGRRSRTPEVPAYADPLSEFAPAAPPPDTPDQPAAPTLGAKTGRPRLIDYLKARQEAGNSGGKEEKHAAAPDIGIRPQPLGSEAPPPPHAQRPGFPGYYPTYSMGGPQPGMTAHQLGWGQHPGMFLSQHQSAEWRSSTTRFSGCRELCRGVWKPAAQRRQCCPTRGDIARSEPLQHIPGAC